MTAVLSPQDALVAVMIATSKVDNKQSDAELLIIEGEINSLSAFRDYDHARIPGINSLIDELFEEEEGREDGGDGGLTLLEHEQVHRHVAERDPLRDRHINP